MEPIYIDIGPILSNLQIEDRCGAAIGRVNYVPVSVLQDAPRADVSPVIHAKWEKITRTARYVDGIGIDVETRKPFINKKEYNYDEYKCPICKKFAKGDYLRFCDYCGAKFDEMFEEETND